MPAPTLSEARSAISLLSFSYEPQRYGKRHYICTMTTSVTARSGRFPDTFTIIFSMAKLNKPAILVVDMLNDFVTGALGCERARDIVPATAELLDAARAAGVPVIFCNDAHIQGIDHELKLWGDHAIAGTTGAEVIPELKVSDKDYIVPKRRYSGFFQTLTFS